MRPPNLYETVFLTTVAVVILLCLVLAGMAACAVEGGGFIMVPCGKSLCPIPAGEQ